MSVGRVAETSAMTATTAPKSSDRVSEEKSTTLASEHTDKFVKSETGYTPAYTKATVTDNRSGKASDNKTDNSSATAKANGTGFSKKSALQIKNEGMKDIVAKLLGQQATGGSKTGFDSQINSLLRSYGLTPIQSDGSDDFWGAEKTANRILDFAKALAGSDPEAFKTVKNAVDKAYGECEDIWGGKLPGVCYDTYDLIQKGFDDWEKELNADKAEAETTEA